MNLCYQSNFLYSMILKYKAYDFCLFWNIHIHHSKTIQRYNIFEIYIYIQFIHISYRVCKTEKYDIEVFELQKYHTLMSYVIEYKIIR
jgi:hypothetical protein